MKHDRQAIVWSFTPSTNQKIKTLKKRKKRLEIPSFYISVPKILIICYTVPEIWHVMDVIVVSFLANFLPFSFYPTSSQTNHNLKKMKNTWRYHHLTQVYQT